MHAQSECPECRKTFDADQSDNGICPACRDEWAWMDQPPLKTDEQQD